MLSEVENAVLAIAEADLREAYKITRKQDRYAAVDAGEGEGGRPSSCRPSGEAKFDPEQVKSVFKDAQAKVVRWNILDEGKRIDGRDLAHRAPDPVARSASCRAPTARRCSPAARPRRWS